jgi:hypothetical protein
MMVNPAKEEHVWKGNEEMMEVTSRPASIRERGPPAAYPSDEEGDDDEEKEDHEAGDMGGKSDTRSVRSMTMLSRVRSNDTDKERDKDDLSGRVSISDRLASIGVLGRLSSPPETSPAGEQVPGKVSIPCDGMVGADGLRREAYWAASVPRVM